MIRTLKREHPNLADALVKDTWGYERVWMVGDVWNTKERGLPVRTWTHKYLSAMSLGPWRIAQQVHQNNLLVQSVGSSEFTAISYDDVARLPFRLAWQTKQATTLHLTLGCLGLGFNKLCARLSKLEGQTALGVLSRLSGVTRYSKCLEFFVREGLMLDAFRNQVEAQTGKKISPEAAAEVLAYSDSVEASLMIQLAAGDVCY